MWQELPWSVEVEVAVGEPWQACFAAVGSDYGPAEMWVAHLADRAVAQQLGQLGRQLLGLGG